MKLFSENANAPSLYMVSETNPLSVRYLINTEMNPVIPFMFKAGIDDKFTITCNFDLEKFDTVILEDRKLHYFQDLKAVDQYIFTASKNDDANRFALYFGAVENNFGNQMPVRVFTDRTNLIVDLTLVSSESVISVFDIRGQLLFNQKLSGETKHYLNFKTFTQIVIVSINNTFGSFNQKIIWNNN